MIQLGSILKVTDKTCVSLVQCIKVLSSAKHKIAKLGEVIIVSVQWINVKKFTLLKMRLQKKFYKGSIHRALIIRTKTNFQRLPGVYVKFGENAVVIVTRNVVPVSNRIYGPILREMCMRWPSLGCVANYII